MKKNRWKKGAALLSAALLCLACLAGCTGKVRVEGNTLGKAQRVEIVNPATQETVKVLADQEEVDGFLSGLDLDVTGRVDVNGILEKLGLGWTSALEEENLPTLEEGKDPGVTVICYAQETLKAGQKPEDREMKEVLRFTAYRDNLTLSMEFAETLPLRMEISQEERDSLLALLEE